MSHPVKTILRRIAGVFLVLLGLIGLLLPILPGWLFLVPGAVLLGCDIPTMVRFLGHLELRFPRFRGLLGIARRWLHRYHTGEDCGPPTPGT